MVEARHLYRGQAIVPQSMSIRQPNLKKNRRPLKDNLSRRSLR